MVGASAIPKDEQKMIEAHCWTNLSCSDPESGSKGRSRRYLKRESRGLKSQRSRSDGVAKMVPRAADLLPHEWAGENASGSGRASSPPPSPFLHNPVYLLLAEPPRRKRNGTGDSVDGGMWSPRLPRMLSTASCCRTAQWLVLRRRM